MSEHDHGKALDGLRASLLEEVGALWKHRVLWRGAPGVRRCNTVLAGNAEMLRKVIGTIRALDAVRQAAKDASHSLRNVKALAKRMRHRGDVENAGHLLRFCAEGGEPESEFDILRAKP